MIQGDSGGQPAPRFSEAERHISKPHRTVQCYTYTPNARRNLFFDKTLATSNIRFSISSWPRARFVGPVFLPNNVSEISLHFVPGLGNTPSLKYSRMTLKVQGEMPERAPCC